MKGGRGNMTDSKETELNVPFCSFTWSMKTGKGTSSSQLNME